MISLTIGGVPADSLGATGDLKWSTVYGREGGGVLTISFSLALPRNFSHPALCQGSLVELFEGTLPLGSAIMAEPDRSEWSFVADGLYRLGEHYAAVDASGNPSTDVAVIVAAAITGTNRILPWKDPGNLPTGSLSTASEAVSNLNTITAVLNAYCENNGKRWMIDRTGYLRIVTDPTTSRWALTPEVPGIATVDDDYVSRYFGRRVSAVDGSGAPSAWAPVIYPSLATATPEAARYGVREQIEGLEDLGVLSAGDAQTILAARLATERARPAPSQGVTVTPDQIMDRGGVSAYLPFVRAGQRLDHLGVRDSDGNLSFGQSFDWVIGSSEHEASSRSITIAPVGLAPRTTASVIAAQQKAAQAVFV